MSLIFFVALSVVAILLDLRSIMLMNDNNIGYVMTKKLEERFWIMAWKVSKNLTSQIEFTLDQF